jgi:hypothetical protein
MAKRTSEKRTDKTLDMADAIREHEGDVEFPERYADAGIQARREQVWKFLARRVPQTVMAELLGVSRRTVSSDVRWWKEQCQGYVEHLRDNPEAASADIGLTALRLEGMAQFAMNEAQLAGSGTLKNQFINTAIRAEETRSGLLIKTGALPKAGEDIRVSHNIKATFSAKLGTDSPLASLDDPSSRRRVLSAAEQILRLTTRKKFRSDDDDDMPIVILDEPEAIEIEGRVKDVG